jgi:hypothetical protein
MAMLRIKVHRVGTGDWFDVSNLHLLCAQVGRWLFGLQFGNRAILCISDKPFEEAIRFTLSFPVDDTDEPDCDSVQWVADRLKNGQVYGLGQSRVMYFSLFDKLNTKGWIPKRNSEQVLYAKMVGTTRAKTV